MSDNLFICKICNKSYTTEHGLKVHVSQFEKISYQDYKIKYLNEKLICPICNIRNLIYNKGHYLKTCGHKECIQKLREKTGIINNGFTAAKLGAQAAKNEWNSLSENEQKLRINKIQQTNERKFGVRSYSQTMNFKHQHSTKYEYDNLIFDSKPELEVYKFCKENKYTVEYQPNIIFEYIGGDNKKHYYHPDFLINGKLYEVKGSFYINKNGELYMPYSRNRENIEILDKTFKAKQEVMKNNNVCILIDGDIEQLRKNNESSINK